MKSTIRFLNLERNGKPAFEHFQWSLRPIQPEKQYFFFKMMLGAKKDLHNTLSELKSDQVSEIIKETDSNRIVFKTQKRIR